ncbi:MAG: hypothetical protein GW949_03970 [Spirochaetales bacterium]|nr:hypothetical protein [Spirochaetales bacterium]
MRRIKTLVGVVGLLFLGLSTLFAQQRILREDLNLSQRTPQIERTFTLSQPTLVDLKAVSTDLTPEIVLTFPDGTTIFGVTSSFQSTLSLFAPQAGTYTVVISAGSSRITDPGKVVLAVDSVAPLSRLSGTATVSGELTTSSVVAEGPRYVNWYEYTMPPSGRANITLSSDDYDTYLLVYRADGTSESNDDAGDGTNSGLRVSAAPGSTILIGASVYYADSVGFYNLEVAPAGEPRRVNLGQEIRGSFESSGLGDEFQFDAPAEGRYIITLNDPSEEGYVQVVDEFGTTLSEYEQSRVVARMAGGDKIFIEPQSWSGSGQYRLMISQAVDSVDLGFDQTIYEYLTPGDIMEYEIVIADYSGLVEIDLQSDDFDTYLEVETSFGDDYSDDDSYGGELSYRSVVSFEVERGDVLYIVVRGYSDSGSGEFTLHVGPTQEPEGLTEYYEDMPLEIGSTQSFRTDGYRQTFSLTLTRGQLIEITMSSDDIDSYLEIEGPRNFQNEDDDGAGNLNSLLAFTVPADGFYTLIARPLSEGSTGYYTLSIDSGSGR